MFYKTIISPVLVRFFLSLKKLPIVVEYGSHGCSLLSIVLIMQCNRCYKGTNVFSKLIHEIKSGKSARPDHICSSSQNLLMIDYYFLALSFYVCLSYGYTTRYE